MNAPPQRAKSSSPLRSRTAKRHRISGDDLLADRPQRDASKFQMRPGERDADDRHREHDRGDEMAERQSKAGEHEPDNVTDEPEQPRAEIVAAGMFGARYCFAAERQQRVRGDVERSAGPGNPDNRDRHDNGGDHPGDGHPQTAEYDP